MSRHLYTDGDTLVLVETGMPEHHVKIGLGRTLAEATKELSDTPIQSTGRDSGLNRGLAWAHNHGWISDPDDLEESEIDPYSDDEAP